MGDQGIQKTKRFRIGLLCVDLALSAVFCGGVPLLCLWLFTLRDFGILLLFTGLFLLLPAVHLIAYYIIPGLLILLGLAFRRPGLVLGPLVLGAVLHGLEYENQSYYQKWLDAYAPPTLAAPSQSHAVLAFEVFWNCGTDCGHYLRNVLATSQYAVAVQDNAPRGEWQMWRRGEGAVCLDKSNAASALDFISDGFIGLCAIITKEPKPADAILFRARDIATRNSRAEDVTVPFNGMVMEVVERIDSHDHLLGRSLTGTVDASPWAMLIGRFPVGQYRTGAIHGDKDFIAWALNSSVESVGAQGPASVEARLDATEQYFDISPAWPNRYGTTAPKVWDHIAYYEWRSHPEVFLPRVERFLVSKLPGPMEAAVSALQYKKSTFSDGDRARLVTLLKDCLDDALKQTHPDKILIAGIKSRINELSPDTP